MRQKESQQKSDMETIHIHPSVIAHKKYERQNYVENVDKNHDSESKLSIGNRLPIETYISFKVKTVKEN